MWRTPSGTVVDTGQEELSLLIYSSTITISNITASDGGNYTCIAENVAVASEASAVLYVHPYITEQPVDLLTENGTLQSITCMAESFPAPRFHWERQVGLMNDTSGSGSGEIVNSGSSSITSGFGEDLVTYNGDGHTPLRPKVGYEIASVGQILSFNPVLFGDEGIYHCIASTLFGEDITHEVTVFSEFESISRASVLLEIVTTT